MNKYEILVTGDIFKTFTVLAPDVETAKAKAEEVLKRERERLSGTIMIRKVNIEITEQKRFNI